MPLKNTPQRFGLISKLLHWVTALLIFCLLTVGYVMAGLVVGPDKINLIFLHKSFGILVLMLAVVRLAWRHLSPRPGRDPRVKPWEDRLASLVHGLLYVCVIAMPLSGWMMSSAGDYPATFFGLFSLPKIVPKNPDIMAAAKDAHEILALAILGLLALHFAGASKHHLIDGDDTLRRMTFQNLGRVGGFAFLAVLGMMYLAPVSVLLFGDEEEESAVPQIAIESQQEQTQINDTGWIVLPGGSIEFEAMQSGQPFNGTFRDFRAQIIFDPANLAASDVTVTIPISGINTGDPARDAQIVSADWFNAAQFPEAVFKTTRIESAGVPDQYLAHGNLTVRGVTRDIDLPFTLSISEQNGNKQAVMSAELGINRLDYSIGQGAWAKTDVVGDTVRIRITLSAVAPAIDVAPKPESR